MFAVGSVIVVFVGLPFDHVNDGVLRIRSERLGETAAVHDGSAARPGRPP